MSCIGSDTPPPFCLELSIYLKRLYQYCFDQLDWFLFTPVVPSFLDSAQLARNIYNVVLHINVTIFCPGTGTVTSHLSEHPVHKEIKSFSVFL
jgi:hypothetical protein